MPQVRTPEESSKVPMVDEENYPPHRDLQYGDITYRLGHQIARGGFSTVFKARDAWDNELAIKVFNEDAHPYMWENEVRNYLELRHPGITYMHGAFQLNGLSYIALEHGGLSVGRVRLDEARERHMVVLLAAKGMLEAIHFMHDKGYVHTDVNPGNALLQLTADNRPVGVKLCDLGLSARAENLMVGQHKAKWNPSPECIDAAAFGKESFPMDVYSTAQVLLDLLHTDELGRFTDEEICNGGPRDYALALKTPLAEALAEALHPKTEDRVSALRLWRLLRKSAKL